MPEFLNFINEQEEQLIRERAERATYEPEALILAEGDERNAIFLIREGVVRVELEHPEFNIEITRLSSGEIFGEMSFLEGMVVSANVIAHGPVALDIVDKTVIDELSDRDAGFYGRFYQSLAEILSLRLRETTLRGFG